MKDRTKEIGLVAVIILIGVVIRLIPNIIYFAWGNDYGIYYYLSQAFLTGKSIVYPPNSPWGNDGYQYFPVTYLVVIGVHYLLQIPVNEALSYSIPFLGGLTPFLLYLIARELGFNRYISGLSGLLLAVNPVQVYQTSQANYLTTGHFFLLLSILMFLKFHKDKRYSIGLGISVVLLILSHQLSTYIFLISLIGMVVSVNLLSNKWRTHLLWDSLIIELTGTFMMLYLLLRVPHMVSFFSKAVLGIGYGGLMVIFYFGALLIYFGLRKWNSQVLVKKISEMLTRLKLNIDPRRDFYLTIISTLSIMLVFVFGLILGLIPSYITIYTLFISIPFFLFLAISIVGLKYFLTEMNISEVFGWSMIIVLSLLYSLFSKNTVLLPARDFEYMAEPFSIVAAFVIYKWDVYYQETRTSKEYSSKKSNLDRKMNLNTILSNNPVKRFADKSGGRKTRPNAKRLAAENVVIIVAISLVLLMGVLSYPMASDYIPSHTEAITFQDEAVVQYLNETGNRNLSVATDHQLGIYIESYGFSSPFNNLSIFWNTTNWTNAIWQITGENGSYLPVGYIIISSFMLEYGVWGFNGTSNPNAPPIYMNNSSFEKFFVLPMELTYKNTSISGNISSYLFTVNWTFLNSYLTVKGFGNLSYFQSLYYLKNGNASAFEPSINTGQTSNLTQSHAIFDASVSSNTRVHSPPGYSRTVTYKSNLMRI